MKNIIYLSILSLLIACSGRENENKIMLESENSDKYDEQAKMDSLSEPGLAKNLDMSTKTPEGKKFTKTVDLKFQVEQVISATEKIEDLASAHDGFLIYSNLQNRQENYCETKISRDSILVSKQITVYNSIQLKVPNEKLDSFIRKLNPLVSFLDYRVIKLDEVTLDYLTNSNKTKRLQAYEQRQLKHFDSKDSRLKDATNAENNLLDRQNDADNVKLNSMKLDDDIKYCTVTLEIYQKPIIIHNVIPDFQYISDQKPNFFKRIGNSVVIGWHILEEIIVFLVKLWGFVLVVLALIFGIKYTTKLYKKLNQKQ